MLNVICRHNCKDCYQYGLMPWSMARCLYQGNARKKDRIPLDELIIERKVKMIQHVLRRSKGIGIKGKTVFSFLYNYRAILEKTEASRMIPVKMGHDDHLNI